MQPVGQAREQAVLLVRYTRVLAVAFVGVRWEESKWAQSCNLRPSARRPSAAKRVRWSGLSPLMAPLIAFPELGGGPRRCTAARHMWVGIKMLRCCRVCSG